MSRIRIFRFGGRIRNELSKQILAGKVNEDSTILVDMKSEVEFEFINQD